MPFSQRTSITHVPTIYEELIQKYEGDIRNHIRIEQQMKLHSDSVLNKLEDKEKQYERMIDKFRAQEKLYTAEKQKLKMETKVVHEENQALKKALEKKIERVLNVEHELRDFQDKFEKVDKELSEVRRQIDESDLTPRKHKEKNVHSQSVDKSKYKSNSANPSSSRKSVNEPMPLFYSRNVKGPNNCQKEELLIPNSSTRSPQKYQMMNPSVHNSIIVKQKDGRSPYVHADLERLRQYMNMPKSKSHKRSKSQTVKGKQGIRKGAKSALKIKQNTTADKSYDESIYSIKDYPTVQNQGYNKSHFKSYDVHSSLNKYELARPQAIIDMSVDKLMKKSKKSKVKSKRHSSISKNGKESRCCYVFKMLYIVICIPK